MARRAVDEAIAEYAEKSRGEFKANELRRFVREVKVTHRNPQGRYFNVGDVILVMEEDAGIMMDQVCCLTRHGIMKVRRVSLTMNTEVV